MRAAAGALDIVISKALYVELYQLANTVPMRKAETTTGPIKKHGQPIKDGQNYNVGIPIR